MSDLHQIAKEMIAHQRRMDLVRKFLPLLLRRPTKAIVTNITRKTSTGAQLSLWLGGLRG